jgi:hypothetical protein
MSENSFSSTLEVIIYTRPADTPYDAPPTTWQEFDRGPGFFHLPEDVQAMVRIRTIDDAELETLINDIKNCPAIIALNLSENRKITDRGLEHLKALPHLIDLNLSSVGMTNDGLPHLAALSRLQRLNLSYCNRILDDGLKVIKSLPRLTYLDVQGCAKLTHNGIIKISRRNLNIHK